MFLPLGLTELRFLPHLLCLRPNYLFGLGLSDDDERSRTPSGRFNATAPATTTMMHETVGSPGPRVPFMHPSLSLVIAMIA